MLGKYWIFYVHNGKAEFVLDCNTLKEVCNCRMELVKIDKEDGTYEPDSYHIVRIDNPNKMKQLWNEGKLHLYKVNCWIGEHYDNMVSGHYLALSDSHARWKGKLEMSMFVAIGNPLLLDMVRCSARKIG